MLWKSTEFDAQGRTLTHSSHGELPLPLASPMRKLIRHHHTILHGSDQTCSPTWIQPSQAIHMFSESMLTRMRVDGKGDDSSGDGNGGSNGDDNGSEGEGNGSNSNYGNISNNGDDDSNDGDNEDGIDDNDIIPPAVAAHGKRVHLQ